MREIRSAEEARQLHNNPAGFFSSTANTPSVARTDDRGSTPDLFRSVAHALGVDTKELPQPFYGVPWAHDDDDYDDDDDDDEEKDGGGGGKHGGVHGTSSTFIRRQPAVVPARRDRNDSATSATSVSPYSQPYHAMPYGREPVAAETAGPLNTLPIRSSAELYGDTPRLNPLPVEPAWKPVAVKDMVVRRNSRVVPVMSGEERNGKKLVERESMTPLSPLLPSGRPRLSSIVSPIEPSSPESSVKARDIRDRCTVAPRPSHIRLRVGYVMMLSKHSRRMVVYLELLW